MGMGMSCWDRSGNDSTGMVGNGNNNSHCRTPLCGKHTLSFMNATKFTVPVITYELVWTVNVRSPTFILCHFFNLSLISCTNSAFSNSRIVDISCSFPCHVFTGNWPPKTWCVWAVHALCRLACVCIYWKFVNTISYETKTKPATHQLLKLYALLCNVVSNFHEPTAILLDLCNVGSPL